MRLLTVPDVVARRHTGSVCNWRSDSPCRCALRCLLKDQSVIKMPTRIDCQYLQLRMSSLVSRKSGSVTSSSEHGRLQLSIMLMQTRTQKADPDSQKFLAIAFLTIAEVTSSLAKSMTRNLASNAATVFPAMNPQAARATKYWTSSRTKTCCLYRRTRRFSSWWPIDRSRSMEVMHNNSVQGRASVCRATADPIWADDGKCMVVGFEEGFGSGPRMYWNAGHGKQLSLNILHERALA